MHHLESTAESRRPPTVTPGVVIVLLRFEGRRFNALFVTADSVVRHRFFFFLVVVIVGRRRFDAEPAGRVDVEDDGLDVELVAPAVVVVLAVSARFSRCQVLFRCHIAAKLSC